MLPPVPLYFPRRKTDHSLLAPALPQAAAPYDNMVTTTTENLLQKLIKSDRWNLKDMAKNCLLYTSPSPRDQRGSRMPSSA